SPKLGNYAERRREAAAEAAEKECPRISRCALRARRSNVAFFHRLVRTTEDRDVAQPGSAPDWGSGGRRFKSCRPDHFLTFHGALGNTWVTTQRLMGGGRASTQSHRTNHQRVESAGVGPHRVLRRGHARPLPSHFD